MFHFTEVLTIPAIVGIQGKAYLFLGNKVITLVSAGLLLLRAYAVTDHKRLVLSVLGILGICAIGPELVCTHFCDWHLWPTSMTGIFSFDSLCPYQFTTPHFANVSPMCFHRNYAQWSIIRGKHVKMIFIMASLTVFFSWWHRFDPRHIIWHGCGCCDTRWHTGNMESVQKISMERTDTHTFTGWTKYVIISVSG